jgi:outer membrane protein OmpA-like peptidoglycan-associated protein
MNRNVVAAILILLLGVGAIGIYKVVARWAFAKQQEEAKVGSSDSKVNQTIRVGGDSYLGYFFMNSPEMKRQAAIRGIGVDFTNDGGAYAERLQKFKEGKYEAIVLPINSYLQHGLPHNYPGVIVCSIAESKGADAILAFSNKLPTGKVTDLNDASLKIVYTADSPSSFLLDLTTVDFDLFNLKRTDEWRVKVEGSDKAFERAKRREGDAFVMWEPDVTRALHEIPDLKVVWGSDRFSGYIIDVFVFRRDFVKSNEADVVAFFEAYFSAQRAYKSDRAKLLEDMKQVTGLKGAELEAGLKKIDWYDLQSNCSRQFGIKDGSNDRTVEGVLNTIIACTNVLVKTGALQKDPLGDPYRIINSSILKQVQTRLPAELGASAGKRAFSPLADEEWKQLSAIGTMRVEPIAFKQGSAELDETGEAQLDEVGKLLSSNYPDTRVVVTGHTGPGDEDENTRLSRQRAEKVIAYLSAKHGLSPNRFRPDGKGSSDYESWLVEQRKRPDFNPRTVLYRAPRVEFCLFMDTGF